MKRSFGLMALAWVAAAGCDGGKTAAGDTFTDLQGLDEKSDSFSYRMKIVGSLDYGQTSDPVKYTSNPRYRAFKFGGNTGDQVTVDVKSTNGGDAVTWVLDNDFNVVAYNDDASSKTADSHIEVKLPSNASITHYIVFRDYYLSRATFTVSLKGKSTTDFYSCTADADCEKVQAACCQYLGWTAVRADQAGAYQASLGCAAHQVCPAIAVRPDDRIAECNTGTGKCELVEPGDIHCGGFTRNPHQCPDGWLCRGAGLVADIPGQCYQACGGIAARPCPDMFSCADDPLDECDPNNGGADCGGLCLGPGTCAYGIGIHHAGDSFPSTDGCNTCSCTSTGVVRCTERFCPNPNP